MPVFSWQLEADVTATVTVNAVATALNIATTDKWGYASTAGTLPSATPATDSVAYAIRTALLTHGEIAAVSVSYVWTSGAVGAGPIVRLDITTDSAISTAPTLAATGANADTLGITSSPVTATALAATPTTQWRFEIGPVAGFWWPAQQNVWDNTAVIRAVFTAQAFANGEGEAVLWGSRSDMAIVLPVVRGAYVSLVRRQSQGYADQIGVSILQPNNLLDAMLDAAASNHAIRVYRDVDTYFTGKILSQSALADVRSMAQSQAAQDAIAQYTIPLSGVS